jgi:hypothetical protein
MKNGTNKRILLLACFAMALVPALAQTPGPLSIGGLPAPRSDYTFQSGVHVASLGIISADVDRFTSVFDFSALQSHKYFGYAGINETLAGGLNGGFAATFGKVYLGIGYGGTAIADAIRPIPNQTLVGDTSENTLNVLVGYGILGVKLGFTEFMEKTAITGGNIRESNLKPSLEVGVNLLAGPVRIKPAVRGAWGIHQYRSTGRDGDTTTAIVEDFSDPSVGITLGLDFGRSEENQMELDINGDAAFRRISGDGLYAAVSTPTETTRYNADDIHDIRITGSPSFIYRHAFNKRIVLGARAEADVEFDIQRLPQTQTTAAGVKTKYDNLQTYLSIVPNVSVGAQFNMIPDRFSIQGSFGIPILAYSQTQAKTRTTDPSGVLTAKAIPKTSEIEWVPALRFAIGMTINLTENSALDFVASAEGLGMDTIESTKFAIQFTIKK